MRAISKFAVAAISLWTATPGIAAVTSEYGSGFTILDATIDPLSGLNVPGTGFSSIAVGARGTINSLTVSIDDLYHPFAGDLIATLSNGSTTISLFDRLGAPASTVGSSINFFGSYTFSDSASLLLPEGGPPFQNIPTASYVPAEALSAFNGQETAGDWVLTLSDHSMLNTGGFRSWTLNIDYNEAAVPEPATWAMLICGFALVGAGMRRRSKMNVAFA